jgi:hypothetical protein
LLGANEANGRHLPLVSAKDWKTVSLVNQDVVPSENPFEGKSTDVPITTVSREMLSEPQYDTQT